ncbi:MAG: translation elongation factor Ts [Sumerlaeia bacterium]
MAATITAAQVKALRDDTGLPMMDCKKALAEADGDKDKAIKLLRERGELKAAGRQGRAAAEGYAAQAVASDNSAGAIVELNCETDFSARNETFVGLAQAIAAAGLATGADSLDALQSAPLADGRTVKEAVEDIRNQIREKIELSSYQRVTGDLVVGYTHMNGVASSLVAAKAEGLTDDKRAAAADELRSIAMHIVAAFPAPRFLDRSQVDQATLDNEREILTNITRNEGKPEAMIAKIVDGRMNSFYKDNCLVDQAYVREPKQSVKAATDDIAKGAGAKLTLIDFARVKVGEKASASGEGEE